MLKKSITYTDFDDVEQTEVHYFNLTKSELIEMEYEGEGGSLVKQLQNNSDGNDKRELVRLVKMIVLKSYGVRDGSRFAKTDEIANDFSHSPAYDALFTEFVTEPKAFLDFMTNVIPKDLRSNLETPAIETIQAPEAFKKPEKPKDPKDMTREELLAAYREKSSQL